MFGTPCTSFSFARWPQLRDWLHPKGKQRLTQSQQEQVANGNKFVEWTAVAINSLVAVQCYFILENLLPGWMWVQPEIMAILQLPTVVLIEIFFQQFGAPYLKSTGLLSNLPYIWWMSSKADMDVARVPLRGQMFWNGQWVFRTKVAEPYPPLFGLALSLVVQLSIGARKLALAHGDRLPSPDKKYDAATHRGMCQHVLTGGPDETCWMDAADIKNSFVNNGGGAVKGFSVSEHVAWAQLQTHPMANKQAQLTDELTHALQYECPLGA